MVYVEGHNEMKLTAYVTKPHGDQRTWEILIITPDFEVFKTFKTMKSAMRWMQTWSAQRRVQLQLEHTVR